MRFVGRVSYPLYLMHPLALGVAASVVAPGGTIAELAYTVVGLTLSVGLAYGLHRVVERPLIRTGKRLAARTGVRARVPAPVPALASS
jgi:peptidoglycan/LPS O-acetylase OafA/YrhL